MIKHVVTFTVTFILGALIALAARTATHSPHESPANAAPAPAAPAHAHDHAAAGHTSAMPSPAPAATPAPAPAPAQENPGAPVNTICAICGMKVDPSLPTLEYQGKRIGFGCRMCPPKFKADPDKYGPYYLRNELMPK